MKIDYRMKRTTKQYIIVAVICIIIIGGAALLTILFVTNQIRSEYTARITEVENDKRQNQRLVYVATEEIPAGGIILESNTKMVTVYSSQPQNSFITGKEYGQQALIDIPADTQLMKTMLTQAKVTSELREVEYQVLNINSNIRSNDTVDVRVMFPNGESFIVLSKKVIRGITEGSVLCYLWLDAQEILRMSAAIVDAALYPGSQLITTRYIEPSIQNASEITYTPGLSILALLETDPNILDRSSQELEREVRKALENRLANSMSMDVTQISWDVNPNKSRKAPVNREGEKTSENIPGTDREEVEEITDTNKTDETAKEFGSSEEPEFFYYVQEQEAKDGVLEYGE